MNSKGILLVEDEAKIVEVLSSYLESCGFSVSSVSSGHKALELLETGRFSLVLLDLMLPDISGEEVCQRIRSLSRIPIIMITAKIDEASQLQGLQIGADDYVTKPFSLQTLKARIEAVLRRSEDKGPLCCGLSWNDGDLRVDFSACQVFRKGKAIAFTPSEYKLFQVMASNPHKSFTRDELIEAVFSQDYMGYDRAIDGHIKNMRQKLEDDPRNPCYILTVHGIGYKFSSNQKREA